MPNVKLASRQCATCIFRPNSGFDLDKFRKRWGKFAHQTCHQFRVVGQRRSDKNPDVWCRGYWEHEAPADFKAFVEAVGLVEIVKQRDSKTSA